MEFGNEDFSSSAIGKCGLRIELEKCGTKRGNGNISGNSASVS